MREGQIKAAQGRLLAWYDAEARDLPWRIPPAASRAGHRPDPYRVWLSEVMLQQTTVAAVQAYFARFLARWPDVAALAAAPEGEVMAEWAGLGYYSRARNLHACAQKVVADHGGRFPADLAALRALPGIGPYTAAAIAAIAFGIPATVVDGNVERVTARLFALTAPLPAARPALHAAAARLAPQKRPGDFAQAMMDLGARICTPRRPRCGLCPLSSFCAAKAEGLAESLPRKAPKPPKPQRQGQLWLARRADGAWLLERREKRGLLGGMLGWPGDGWDGGAEKGPPLKAAWRKIGTLRHSFTHFDLVLEIAFAEAGQGANPERGSFLEPGAFDPKALPSVMRKAWDRLQDESFG